MAKIRIELRDGYTVAGVVVALATMTICYLNRDTIGGVLQFVPKVPGKEWWTISTLLIMRVFSSKIVTAEKSKIVQHICGTVVVGLLFLAGVFEYLGIDPGTQYWSLIGSVLGVWTGASQNGS